MSTIEVERADNRIVHLPSQRRDWAIWRFCAWSGPFFIVAFLTVWAGVAGFFPPPSENWDADRVVKFLSDDSVRIRLGMGLAVFVSGFYLFWTLAIARVMKAMEPSASSPLTRLQVYGGLGTMFAIIFFGLVWATAAFQASERDADPHTVQMLHDLGWIAFDLVGMPTMIQMCAIGALLISPRDPGEPQLMPRWVAYLCFFVASIFLEVLLLLFIKTGPFAWHGVVTYYVILAAFFIWMLVISFYSIKAIKSLEAQERSAAAAA